MSMKFLIKLSGWIGAALLLTACASTTVKERENQQVKSGILELANAPVLAAHGAHVSMLYFSENNALIYRRDNGTELTLSGEKDAKAQLTEATLHSDGAGLYAVWRPKLSAAIDGVGVPGDKLLYFRASLDNGQTFGPLHRLNRKGGAFKPFVQSNGEGDLYVTWTDERNSSSNIDVYFTVSHDRGTTWTAEDIKINGAESKMSIEPTLVADKTNVHVSWMTRTEAGEFKIFVRSSMDRGQTWLEPVPVSVSTIQPASPKMVKTSTGLLLCWVESRTVRCSQSMDRGKSWGGGEIVTGTEGTGRFELQADRQGRAHLLMLMRPDSERETRSNLFHMMQEGDGKFSTLQRLNGGEPFKRTTLLPSLTFGDDGSALAVWVDMRYMRPFIAANYSKDAGKNWLENDIFLAGKLRQFHFFPVVSYAGYGNYTVAWQETPSRTVLSSDISISGFKPGDTGVSIRPPDLARLKERVDRFWALREQDKWAEVYDLMDPYFREINNRSNYVKSQGNVKYYSHRITGEATLAGVIATIPVAYESEVPEFMLRGKPITVPRVEVEIPHEWVWVDGDWYQVFRDTFGGPALID